MDIIPIPEFPDYGVSYQGFIVNLNTMRRLKISYTKEGTPKVGLVANGRQCWRSAAKLVAEAFVERPNEYCNTPMFRDNDYTNLDARNIVWRPKWYVMEYRLESPKNPWAKKGPLLNVTTNTEYETVGDFCFEQGLLVTRTCIDIRNGHTIWPYGYTVEFL